MVNVAITNELARIAGLIAEKHPECAIQIEWHEGAPEHIWVVTATDGSTDHVYVAEDDGNGAWAPATENDLRMACAMTGEFDPHHHLYRERKGE